VELLEARPQLSPLTLLEHLQERYPGEYPDTVLRTLQRRVKQWRALHGRGKAVMFSQRHEPGEQGLSDFTELKGVTVHIAGEVLTHLLYHFRLVFSGWCFVKVVLGGESFTALAEGLQEALWRLGGVPREHRTDSLSAAYRNIDADQSADLTKSYESMCAHYAMRASRNNRGQSHENGAIESPHGHLKRRITQALALRGSAEFDSVTAYQSWLEEAVVSKVNRRCQKAMEAERPYLQALPQRRTRDYTEYVVPVTSASTITVRCVSYTVPSRLIGERLRVHVYDDRLRAHVGSSLAVELPRVYPLPGKRRARRVDYRHVIEALVKKPRAFKNSVMRDELLPSASYRRAYLAFAQHLDASGACKLIVSSLAIAARHDCEAALGAYLDHALAHGQVPTLVELEREFGPVRAPAPAVVVKQHSLLDYNTLCPNVAEVAHV
jgi:transposase InsO family protein